MRWLALPLLLLLSVSAQGETLSWRLIYSSNFNNELKPCGCSKEGNLGGILRRASRLEQLRKETGRLVTVSAGDILGKRDEQGQIKANYMLRGIAELKLDAILPGEQDLQYPMAVLKKRPLPWVLSNGDDTLSFDRYRERQLGGHRLLILGLLDPGMVTANHKTHLLNMGNALNSVLASRHVTEKDIVIVLIHSTEAKALPFTRHPRVDVVVRGHLDKPIAKIPTGRKAMLAAGHRGQRIGIAEFETNTETRLISNRIETLPKTVPDHPRMTYLYKRYDAEVTKWYRAKVASRKTGQTQSPYAGVRTCATCHTVVYKKWSLSHHASALASLTKSGKDNDPECLQCHNTGMDTPGGFVSPQRTPGMSNVQCEACHGAAKRHAEYPLRHKLTSAFGKCTQCHTEENSPAFDAGRYWSRIAHTKESTLARHKQSISRLDGEYDVIDKSKPIVTQGAVTVTEYFNFYCSRCYILNSGWPNIKKQLKKTVIHKEIPIIFGEAQEPWATLAYLAARRAGKAAEFKRAVFHAKFEENADIDNQETLLRLAKALNLEPQVQQVFSKSRTTEDYEFQRGMNLKDARNVIRTPTVFINSNIKVTPANTGDNTNLMVENLLEILFDLQCRQQAVCN